MQLYKQIESENMIMFGGLVFKNVESLSIQLIKKCDN